MEYEFMVEVFKCCIDENCCSCPLYDFEIEHCEKQIKLQALSFIIRQQAEIEELKKVGNKIDSLGAVAALMDQKERLARFKNEWEREVRAEAVREFAERLKSRIRKDIDEQGMFPLPYTKKAYDTVMIFINNLAKEMTEKEGADNA